MLYCSVCKGSARRGGAACSASGMEDALRHPTGPCVIGSVRRVPDVRWNPLHDGTEQEEPEACGHSTKETGYCRWPQLFR